jgi:hypothetical protein
MARQPSLNPDKALIFRITHRENLPWILRNGISCRSGGAQDPNFRRIGNRELIEARRHRHVPIPPGGTLADYVPFYFTPFSPMLLNIKTGYGGIPQQANDDIVILVSSLRRAEQDGLRFVFTNRHAYLAAAEYFNDLADIGEVDWDILQRRDFKRDPEDPDKFERYQAEALVHENIPARSLLGVVCHSEALAKRVETESTALGLDLKTICRPHWYF